MHHHHHHPRRSRTKLQPRPKGTFKSIAFLRFWPEIEFVCRSCEVNNYKKLETRKKEKKKKEGKKKESVVVVRWLGWLWFRYFVTRNRRCHTRRRRCFTLDRHLHLKKREMRSSEELSFLLHHHLDSLQLTETDAKWNWQLDTSKERQPTHSCCGHRMPPLGKNTKIRRESNKTAARNLASSQMVASFKRASFVGTFCPAFWR